MREKGQECVSKVLVETHNREKKAKNVCQGVSGDTL